MQTIQLLEERKEKHVTAILTLLAPFLKCSLSLDTTRATKSEKKEKKKVNAVAVVLINSESKQTS